MQSVDREALWGFMNANYADISIPMAIFELADKGGFSETEQEILEAIIFAATFHNTYPDKYQELFSHVGTHTHKVVIIPHILKLNDSGFKTKYTAAIGTAAVNIRTPRNNRCDTPYVSPTRCRASSAKYVMPKRSKKTRTRRTVPNDKYNEYDDCMFARHA
jgi:hypothetical protein